MAQEHKLTVRISESEYRPVRVRAAELGRPVSQVVRELLAAWAAGKIELPPPEPEPKGSE
jgi:predicted DNA binding CopG/RHH family protein